MEAIEIPKNDYLGNTGRQLSFYGLSHLGINQCLKDNLIFYGTQMTGTSSLYIKKHYGHPSNDSKRSVALRHTKQFKIVSANNVDWD
jgi:hypothetical protein